MVLAAPVFVADLADIIRVALEKQHLRAAFARVDFGGQRRGVAEFQGDVAFPLRLKRGHVDNDAAARIGAFAQANGEHVARDAKVLERTGQGKAVGRDDADVIMKINKALFIKVLRVHHGAVDVGEDLEFGRAADVIAIAAGAIADDLLAGTVDIAAAHLAGLEGFDHAGGFGHVANPFVAFDAHCGSISPCFWNLFRSFFYTETHCK